MESDLSYWIILVLCLVLSAIFSAAETALTSVPEAYIRKLVDERQVIVKPFLLWLSKPNRVLTTIIVGNNLVNTLAAVVATVYAQKLFDQFVISIATGAVTIALLIVGEITPKTFARHNARGLVHWLMYIIYPIYFLLFPAVWVLSHSAVFLVQLLGGHTKRVGPMATEEDIAYLIRVSHEEGVFKPEQGLMLQSVITFRDTSVREIMVPRTELFSLAVNESFDEVISQVTQHGYTRWPVYDDDIDHVVGIFYVKDLINFQVQGGQDFHLKDHLRKANFIPDSMKLDAVLREFQRKKVHLAIVVDEYGGTAGIVTLEDILEEIVGEIRDEYDKEEEEQTVKQVGEHHFIADGRVSITDLERFTGIELPDDDAYETLGGFIISVFGKIPRKNAECIFQGSKFRVIEVEEKRVVKVEIMKADVEAK
jgi:CBS domain containing-hemolysin-like protein